MKEVSKKIANSFKEKVEKVKVFIEKRVQFIKKQLSSLFEKGREIYQAVHIHISHQVQLILTPIINWMEPKMMKVRELYKKKKQSLMKFLAPKIERLHAFSLKALQILRVPLQQVQHFLQQIPHFIRSSLFYQVIKSKYLAFKERKREERKWKKHVAHFSRLTKAKLQEILEKISHWKSYLREIWDWFLHKLREAPKAFIKACKKALLFSFKIMQKTIRAIRLFFIFTRFLIRAGKVLLQELQAEILQWVRLSS